MVGVIYGWDMVGIWLGGLYPLAVVFNSMQVGNKQSRYIKK